MNIPYRLAAQFFGFAFIIFGSVCCVNNLSPKYGFLSLRSPQNVELYFKREVRGLSYDVMVLSTNKDYCKKPNATSEFIFASDPLPMYYRFEGNTLNLFSTSATAQPSDFESDVRVVQHQLAPLEFADIQKSFRARGLELLDVPIDEKLRCP